MMEAWTPENLSRFLRCPRTHESLVWADAELLRLINRRIERGELSNRVGVKIEEPLDAALINESGSCLYPCYGGLPALLPDEVIELETS